MTKPYVTRLEKTSAYTYEVTLVVQVLAGSDEEAKGLMESQGGHVSSRLVKFLRSTVVYDAVSEADLNDAFTSIVQEEEE